MLATRKWRLTNNIRAEVLKSTCSISTGADKLLNRHFRDNLSWLAMLVATIFSLAVVTTCGWRRAVTKPAPWQQAFLAGQPAQYKNTTISGQSQKCERRAAAQGCARAAKQPIRAQARTQAEAVQARVAADEPRN